MRLTVDIVLTREERSVLWVLWAIGGPVPAKLLLCRCGGDPHKVLAFLPMAQRFGLAAYRPAPAVTIYTPRGKVEWSGGPIVLTPRGVQVAIEIDRSLTSEDALVRA